MFLHASNDGFKLDANHEQPIEADDLPGLIAAFNSREELFDRLARAQCTADVDGKLVVCRRRYHRARGLESVRVALPAGKPRGGGSSQSARALGRIAGGRQCDSRGPRGARAFHGEWNYTISPTRSPQIGAVVSSGVLSRDSTSLSNARHLKHETLRRRARRFRSWQCGARIQPETMTPVISTGRPT